MGSLTDRYERQILIDDFGPSGQARLSKASILVVGLGGLGSSVVFYLSAAGIGQLGLIDDDVVSESNLNRQILYNKSDIGFSKPQLASRRVKDLNPDVAIRIYNERLIEHNASRIIMDYDVVIDATDNFQSKFLLNDICCTHQKTLIHAGVISFAGQIMVITSQTACLRCLFPDIPQDQYSDGLPKPIIGTTAGLMGQLEATEAMKYILGMGELLVNQVLSFDLLTNEFRKMNVSKKTECPVCSRYSSVKL